MTAFVPPGWPPGVQPPGADGFLRTAASWLFDHCPPDFRGHDVLRRHPPLLARLAVEQLAAAVDACRQGYRTARADLREQLPTEVLDALIAAYEKEGRRLAAAHRAALLLQRAIAGERFTPTLGSSR